MERKNMIQPEIFNTLKVIIIMAICIRYVDGKLYDRPKNTVSVVGHLTYFNCSTDEPDGKILWLKENKHVYAGDKILNFDVKRFSVELENKTGTCNLVIRNVTIEDAGSYSCKDIKDIENPGVAALSILESVPLCQSNVKYDGFLGPNDCNIVPEVLNLSCSVTYHGNTPPTLQWKSVKDHSPAITIGEHCEVISNDTMKGGKVECNMRVNVELYFYKSSLVCQTNSSATEQYGCSTGPINVIYAFSSFHVIQKTLDETVKCSANSSAQCSYKWLLNNTVTDEGSSTVPLHKPGFHRCEAMCDMRGSQCSVTAMLVHVNTVGTSIILAIVFVVLFVFSNMTWIICFLQYLLRYKDKRRGNEGEDHELTNQVSNSYLTDEKDVTDGHPLANTEQEKVRSELEATPGRDYVLIIGLYDGSSIRDEVLTINLQNPSDSHHLKEMPISVPKETTAAVYHNTVYVVGLGTNADKIWKYESNSGWNKCASLTQARRKHSVAFVDEVLYICGGVVQKDKTVLDSVEAYNAVDNICKSVGKLVHAVQHSGNCVAYKKSLYIFGGADKDNVTISDVQIYDTVKNTCRLQSNPMPRAHGLMRAALWKDSVILLGEKNCFIYDFSSETWHRREKFKTDVVHFGLVLSNDRIYVIGGGIGTTGANGKWKWECRDDVRSVSIEEIIKDNLVEWKKYAKLPKPCLVHAFAVVREPTARQRR